MISAIPADTLFRSDLLNGSTGSSMAKDRLLIAINTRMTSSKYRRFTTQWQNCRILKKENVNETKNPNAPTRLALLLILHAVRMQVREKSLVVLSNGCTHCQDARTWTNSYNYFLERVHWCSNVVEVTNHIHHLRILMRKYEERILANNWNPSSNMAAANDFVRIAKSFGEAVMIDALFWKRKTFVKESKTILGKGVLLSGLKNYLLPIATSSWIAIYCMWYSQGENAI